jgi:hypothetical protein
MIGLQAQKAPLEPVCKFFSSKREENSGNLV